MKQTSLLHLESAAHPTYRPPALPDLSSEDELIVDSESTGLRWWDTDVPCGWGVGTRDGRRWYFPTRHLGGGNIPVQTFEDWACSYQGFRGKRLVAFKTSFDAHMGRVDGIDFQKLGCTVTDIAHWAALLDDSRRELNLNSVSRTYLQEEKVDLDMSKGAHIYHPAQATPYALQDIKLTTDLRNKLEPMLEDEELMDVVALEDSCILPTVEMEHNGALLDVPKLERWLKESQRDLTGAIMDLAELVGFKVEPTRMKDLRRMFRHLNIQIPLIEKGDPKFKQGEPKETFEDVYLRRIQHPAVHKLRVARKLSSLRAKFLVPLYEEYRLHGRVLYALNQLRSDDGGTISGRYSSSAFTTSPREGINIQQVAGKKVMAALKEVDAVLLKYNIRELFIPAPGRLWLRADAKQIEYRYFAHYAKPPGIIAAYRENPDVDYHNIVMAMIARVLPSITRERTKDLNFAMLFGAGLDKIAYMMRVPVADARKFVDAYKAAFPEAGQLRALAMRLMEERGYVKTILGRRARYQGRDMLNSSLNRIIQGSAAETNKSKIAEVDAVREELDLTMRFTVHDELAVDVPDEEAAEKVKEILNRQTIETNVPILWDVKTADNWAAAA